jgi:hypothetical protein
MQVDLRRHQGGVSERALEREVPGLAENETIRFATYLAPNMWPVYEFIADYVGLKLDRKTSLVVGTSFEQFAAGEVDFGFL